MSEMNPHDQQNLQPPPRGTRATQGTQGTQGTRGGARRGGGRPVGSRGQKPPAPTEMRGLPPLAAHSWLTEDWRARRALRLQRLGEWALMTRARLQLSQRDLERRATLDGEELSQNLWARMEQMRHGVTDLDAVRRRVSLTAVDWMIALSGQTWDDVDRFLRTGDVADLEPGVKARADSVRSAYLALSAERQQSLEDFAAHLYHLENMGRGWAGGTGVGAPTPVTPMPAMPAMPAMPTPEGTPEGTPDDLQALAEDAEIARMADAAQTEVANVRTLLEAAHARLLEMEARETGQTGQAGRIEQTSDKQPPRRKRRRSNG